MPDPIPSDVTQGKQNRLDPPHDLMVAPAEEPSIWMSLAGRDPATAVDHLDRQTSELLAYVQQQNIEIDARQSELNAKLAQLDNELRASRLKSVQEGGADLSRSDSASQEPMVTTSNAPSQRARPSEFQEFEEVEKLVAQLTDSPKNSDRNLAEVAERPRADADRLSHPARPDREPVRLGRVAASAGDVLATDAQTDHHLNPHALASSETRSQSTLDDPLSVASINDLRTQTDMAKLVHSLDTSEIETERRLLAERTVELDRRKAVLQRMQEEIQKQHAEVLEARLATEQLWREIVDKTPADQANELLHALQDRINEQYAAQRKAVEARRNELVELKETIKSQQQEIREQSEKLHEWIVSRHGDLTSFSAEVDARAAFLDRREHRMREEFSKWEVQRDSYQQQLRGLLEKLNLQND